MKGYTTTLLLLCCLVAYSQPKIAIPKKSQYSVSLTLTPQLFLTGMDVENDGIIPETISTKNTCGYTVGAEIERKSKTGFLLNLGMQYGVKWHSITMGYQSLSFFDPSIADALDKLGPQIEYYSGTSSYLKLRLMAGYVIPSKILNGCNIEVKAGISIRTYLTEYTGEYYRGLQFIKNDTIFISEVGNGYAHFGDNNLFQSWGKTAEGYIGLRKELNTQYLKNISIGLEFTRNIFFKGQSDARDVYVNSYYIYGGSRPISSDRYSAKDFSIGLRLSAGLWHKEQSR
jgi:hypothetical protein